MRLRTLLLAALGLLVALPIAGLVWLRSVDLAPYRERLAAEVRAATGRQLAIAGAMELAPSLHPTLRLHDLSLAGEGERVSLATMELQAALLPLLKGRIELEGILLTGADATIRPAAARGATPPPAPAPATVPAPAIAAPRIPTIPFVKALRIQNSRVTFAGAPPDAGRTLRIERLEAAAETPESPIRLTLEGDFDGDALLLSGTLASLPLLLASAEPVRVPDLVLRLGQSDLAGSLLLRRTGPRPRLEADLVADRLDLAPAPRPRAAGGGGGAKERQRVFSTEPLDVAPLRALEAAVRLKAARLDLPGATLEAVEVTLALEDGVLRVEPMAAGFAGARPTARLELDGAKEPPVLALALDAPGIDVGRILKDAGGGDVIQGRGDLTLDLRGRGASPAAIMASLAGEAGFLMTNGRLRGRLVQQAAGLSQVAGLLLARDVGDWAQLHCAAARFAIADGIARARALLLDTDYSTVVGEGSIDLGRERLDLLVAPRPKGVSLSLAVPLRIGGTLAAPSYSLDRGAAAARLLTGVVGALLFPPAALGALAELGAGAAPCLEVARGAASQPATGGGPGALLERGGGEAGRALEELGRGLGGLLGGRR